MTGDLLSYNKVVELAEAIRGKQYSAQAPIPSTEQRTGKKFDVTYISEDELEKRIDPKAPSPLVNLRWMIMLELLRTDRFVWSDANLNKLCPEVKPMGVEEFLKIWWGQTRD